MYFADLTPYTYDGDNGPVGVNIGWLDRGHEFATGTVPDGLVRKLTGICGEPYERHRGTHECELCDAGPFDTAAEMREALREGVASMSVIRVVGRDGRAYFSPAMIRHYIAKHGYKPPEEFIKAVMETELPVKPLKTD